MHSLSDLLPRLRKREVLFFYAIDYSYFLFLSSSSGCAGYAALFYCGRGARLPSGRDSDSGARGRGSIPTFALLCP